MAQSHQRFPGNRHRPQGAGGQSSRDAGGARNADLVGRTILGVIAAPGPAGGPRTIWMLQLDDGSCVEFVTPEGRRQLKRAAQGIAAGQRQPATGSDHRQLALEVA